MKSKIISRLTIAMSSSVVLGFTPSSGALGRGCGDTAMVVMVGCCSVLIEDYLPGGL